MRSVLLVLAAAVCFGTTGTAQALGPDADPLSLGAARILIGGGALAAIAFAMHVAGRRDDATGTSVAPTSGDNAPVRVPPRFGIPFGAAATVVLGALGVLAYQPAFFAGTVLSWQLAIPDFGTVTGPFQITALEYSGSHDGEVLFEIALESAGALAFGAP